MDRAQAEGSSYMIGMYDLKEAFYSVVVQLLHQPGEEDELQASAKTSATIQTSMTSRTSRLWSLGWQSTAGGGRSAAELAVRRVEREEAARKDVRRNRTANVERTGWKDIMRLMHCARPTVRDIRKSFTAVLPSAALSMAM